MNILDSYRPLVEFLGNTLGKNYEVVLHDINSLDHSVIAIANGELTGRKVGAPATNLILRVLQDKSAYTGTSITNYRSTIKGDHQCRSSNYLIRDENDEIIGILCINFNLDFYLQAEQELQQILHLQESDSSTSNSARIQESIQPSIEEVLTHMIDTVIAKTNIPPTRLSTDEKIDIIRQLNKDGLFLIKGGLSSLAKRLNISDPTLYRYLNKIKEQN